MKTNANLFLNFYRIYGEKINCFIILSILAISSFFGSRAFCLGSVLGIFMHLIFYKRFSFGKKNFLILATLVAILAFSLTFLIKIDSSLGRIFIYKVSWKIFKENYFTGIGLGNFKIQYGLEQARYFAKGVYSEKEFLLADNVYYAFNDYWEWTIETGITGLILLVSIIALTIRLLIKRLNMYPHSNSLKILICILTIIFISGFFTHVIENQIFQLVYILMLTYLVIYGNRFSIKFIVLIVVLIITISGQNFHYILNYKSYKEFRKSEILLSIGHIKESRAKCEKIFPSLRDDVEFLIFYCQVIESENNHQKTLNSYRNLVCKRTDYRLFLKLAQCFEKVGDFTSAERAYINAVNIVPNRFGSRYCLFNFYVKTRNFEQATKIKQFMLKMPVKIASEKIYHIKKELR